MHVDCWLWTISYPQASLHICWRLHPNTQQETVDGKVTNPENLDNVQSKQVMNTENIC